MVRATASYSVHLGLIFRVESYQRFKNGFHSFFAWRLARKEYCGEQTGKLACCVLRQDTQRDVYIFMWHTGDGAKQSTCRGTPVYLKTDKKSKREVFPKNEKSYPYGEEFDAYLYFTNLLPFLNLETMFYVEINTSNPLLYTQNILMTSL